MQRCISKNEWNDIFTDIFYHAVSTFGIYGNLPHCIAIKPFMSSWHISCYLFFLFVACHKNTAMIEVFFMQIQSTSKYIWHQKLQQCAELSFSLCYLYIHRNPAAPTWRHLNAMLNEWISPLWTAFTMQNWHVSTSALHTYFILREKLKIYGSSVGLCNFHFLNRMFMESLYASKNTLR